MIGDSGPWTLGILIAMPLGVMFTLACLVGAYALHRHDRHSGEYIFLPFGIMLIVAALFCALGTAFGSFPFNSEYHQWRPVSGTVQQVSSRLVGSGKTVNQRFVVLINGQPFGVDDTRASLLKPGDHVDLVCKKEWQYAAKSGWGCNWG